MEHLVKDVRFAIRALLGSPGLTAVAVLSLALGIGANTTIFTLINSVFLNPLPVEDISSLVAVYTVDEAAEGLVANLQNISFPNYEDVRDGNAVFTDLMAYTFPQTVSLRLGQENEQVFALLVTGNYFDVLGLRPAAGRFFLPEEDETPGTHPVAVIGYGLWQRRFASDPGVIGETVTLNGYGFTVVGVAPKGFKGISSIGGTELWVPSMMYDQVLPFQFRQWIHDRRALLFATAGRLRDGVGMAQAQSQLATIGSRLAQEYPEQNKGRTIGVSPLAEATVFPGLRQPLLLGGAVLMTVVGLVLLIACTNVANLLIARAAARKKEIGIRLSLGAPRRRLVQQFLVESVVLALAGGVAGLAVAYWGRDFIWSFRPSFVSQNLIEMPLDLRVLTFTALVAVVTGVFFGLAPALQSTRPSLVEALKEETRTEGPTRRRVSLRSALVIGQVGLSFVALIAAGLFLRSLDGAHAIDPGFDTEEVALVVVNPGQAGYDEARAEQYLRDLVERVEGLPEVDAAALASNLPLFGGFARTVFKEGQDSSDASTGKITQANTVDLGYFDVLGVPILRGRDFTAADREDSLAVAIVNEEMAAKYWPGADAIGQRFKLYGDDFFRQVVGVAATTKIVTLGEDPQPGFYMPYRQNPSDTMTLYVRSEADAAAALGAAEREIRAVDPTVPTSFSFTVGELIDQSLWASRLGAGLLGVLGALGLVLAAVGLYGVMSYSVQQRRREIGVRMAIGAAGGSVVALVVRQAMTLVAIGVAMGLVVAFVLSRAVAGLLFGISPTDPATFLGVTALLAGVAFVAAFFPAWRASQVDPVTALRS